VKRKIIYVSFIRLTDKVARDWYLDYLLGKGATVEYWDVVALLRREHFERGAKDPDYLRVCRTYGEIEKMLRLPENRDALYVILISYVGRFTRIFRLLSKYDCRMLFVAWGAMPYDPAINGRKIAAALVNPVSSAQEVFYWAKAAALRKLNLVKRFDIVFAAGHVMLNRQQHAARVVPINLCDYDHYVKARACAERLVEGRYAVFLDINLPSQSDLAIFGYPQIDAGSYYRSLNRFFARLEMQHGLEVVIAAHPKADYRASTFDGRAVHRLVTAALVRDAEFVLCHISTALSYAVLNAKPVIFIYTNDMLQAYRNTVIRSMRFSADYLGALLHNIDSGEGREIGLGKPDLARYESYKYDFLTTRQTENTSTDEILWHELNAC
jgi:hypothetical protein